MKRIAVSMMMLLAACATVEQPAPVEEPPPEAQKPATENIAVAGLMNNARADIDANRLGSAAATIERALRLEPRNPRLWHELARVRLRQGELAQAESMAARSNAWAGSDSALRAENQKVIEAAREAARR